ncbi:MAG: hypothetical protein VYE40_11710 [Myxococcota bacterium]|nr:hypothetical protein [Myxococcota bacterium]
MKHNLGYATLLIGMILITGACSGPEQDPPEMMTPASEDMSDDRDMISSPVDMAPPAEDMGASEEDMPLTTDMPADMADLSAEDMTSPPEDMPSLEDMGGEDMPPSMLPLDGFGILTGECDVIDTELASTESFFFANALDFGMDPYDEMDLTKLSAGGQTIIMNGNAGGRSLYSEVFAYEVLFRCEEAVLLKTETQITYQPGMGSITDLLVEMDGQKVGVSVVRAFAFPFEDPYPIEEARRILNKKLTDIQESSARVAEEDRWVKQILSVIAYSEQHAMQIRTAYDELDASVKTDTILLVTTTNGEDGPLYFDE